MQLLWFLPTHGDGRYLASATGGRALTFEYLRQVAEAADPSSAIGACCCPPAAPARIAGWSVPPSLPQQSVCVF